MNHDTVKIILESILQTYATSKGMRVQYHNVEFVPLANETYLKSNILPSVTRSLDLAGKHRLFAGVYQITIVIPHGSSTKPATDILEALQAIYPLNTQLSKSGDTSGFYVIPTTPLQTPEGLIQDTHTIFPVRFEYRVDINIT